MDEYWIYIYQFNYLVGYLMRWSGFVAEFSWLCTTSSLKCWSLYTTMWILSCGAWIPSTGLDCGMWACIFDCVLSPTLVLSLTIKWALVELFKTYTCNYCIKDVKKGSHTEELSLSPFPSGLSACLHPTKQSDKAGAKDHGELQYFEQLCLAIPVQ